MTLKPTKATSAAPPQTAKAELPACTGTWRAGATLPAGYAACRDDDGTVTGQVNDCEDGTRKLGTWDRWWGFAGEEIQEIPEKYLDDPDGGPELLAAFNDCFGS